MKKFLYIITLLQRFEIQKFLTTTSRPFKLLGKLGRKRIFVGYFHKMEILLECSVN